MFFNKDYSAMTLNELVAEEKRMKSKTTTVTIALLVGILAGFAVWSATHKGGFLLTISLLVFALFMASQYSKSLKNIQTEITRRDTSN
jgi:ABC-type Mn2+/Zn2+ transport system permease subunit